MLEVTGSISISAQAAATVTLAKCKSGSVAGVSSAAATKTLAKCKTGSVAAQSSSAGHMVKGSPVGNATQLSNIRNSLAKEYVLLANIDLSGISDWTPIGTAAAPFTGILKGNGFTISNLTINKATTDYVGLFGYCQFNSAAQIPNLRDVAISAADVKGQDYVGALAGFVATTLGTGLDYLTSPDVGILLSKCSAAGVLQGRTNIGGLFGGLKGPEFVGHVVTSKASNYAVFDELIARINGCSAAVNVTGSGENIGGLVGNLSEISIFMSNATGSVNGGDVAGGLVGYGYRCGIRSCYTTGAISGIKRVGGIIGIAVYRPNIKFCYSEGNVTGTGGSYPGLVNAMIAGVGGIVGCTDADFVSECYSKGNISALYRAGGVIGSYTDGAYASANISQVYARGNVSASKGQAGGLIGFIFAGIVELTECYCIGSVTGPNSGAIIGQRGSYIEYGEDFAIVMPNYADPVGDIYFMTDIFYNSDINTASAANGGTGQTAADLQKQSTYENTSNAWDRFDLNWIIDDEEGDLYPQLRKLYEPYGISISLLKGAQGLTFGYLKSGQLFYRQLISDVWGSDVQVNEVADATTMNMFRTSDRIGFAVVENGYLSWILTVDNSMEISSERIVARGRTGDVVVTPDGEAVVFVINDVGSLMQMKADVIPTWLDMIFKENKPLPSDSQMANFKAIVAGSYGFLVWRSRSQHRLMVTSLVKSKVEKHLVRSGTITMSLDSAIVSASIELDEKELS